MGGRYYLKHTINHSVSNHSKEKSANERFKYNTKLKAISYLKETKIDIYSKVSYLGRLRHELYRYGTKYKYKCNLSNNDIDDILRELNDDELSRAYHEHNFKENKDEHSITFTPGQGILIALIAWLIIIAFVLSSIRN